MEAMPGTSRLAFILLAFLALCLLAPYAGLHILTNPPRGSSNGSVTDFQHLNSHKETRLDKNSRATRDPAPEIPEIDELLSK